MDTIRVTIEAGGDIRLALAQTELWLVDVADMQGAIQ